MASGLLMGVAAGALLMGSAAAAQAPAAVPTAPPGSADTPTTITNGLGVSSPSASTTGSTTPSASPAAPASPSSVSEIVVTGSRIRGVAPVGSTVIGVSNQDIAQTGAVNITDALQQVPQVLNLGVSDTTRNSNGGAGNITYASGINIRGIGPYATLTLLDGRRMVQSGASGGLPDPSNVPLIMLDRVEIVPDGASAIYGSDAIAGVANLILRRNFEGVEALVREGTGDSYNESDLNILAGHRWDTGQFTASLERSYHSALNGENRGYYTGDLTSRGGGNYLSSQCSPANVLANGTSYALPGGLAGTANQCDNLKNTDLIPQQERLNFAFTFNQSLGDIVSFYADGLASERNFYFHQGTANATVTVPTSNPYYVAIPGVTGPETVETNFGGQAPAQANTGTETLYQITAGFDVKLPHDFKFETDYTYGQDTARSISDTEINQGALAGALASSNPATAINPYGVGPRTNPAVINSVFNSLFLAPGDNIQQEVEAKIDGPLFHLPGGDVRVALGGEYDNVFLYTGFNGGTLANQQPTRVSGREEDVAGYGEIFIPIVGAGNRLPFVRSLTLDAAGRYESYVGIGSTTNPKVGLNWSPIDGLTLHGSYGTSFRAPNPATVHGAINALFVQPYATPNGIVQGVALSGIASGNPLVPETAVTYSAGADYQPPFFRRLKLSVNYFNIDYEKQINGYLSDLSLLSTPQMQAQFANLIRTGPAAEAAVESLMAQGYPVIGVLPNPVQDFVYGENFNLGSTKADGFDFTSSLSIPTASFGDFAVGLNGTYFLDYLVQVTPTAPVLSEANRILNPLRLRMRGSANWTYGPVSLTSFVNFENAYINDTVTPVQRVDSYTTIDMHLALAIDKIFQTPYLHKTSLLVDVTNITDADPPFVNIAESSNGGGGFDPSSASPIGRLISVAIDKKW